MPEVIGSRRALAAGLCLILTAATCVAHAAGSLDSGLKKAAQCAACHGKDGLSRRPDVPHIAGQSEIYMSAQLRHFRSGEREHPEMSIIAKGLSNADIDDLAAWYSSIKVEVKLPQ